MHDLLGRYQSFRLNVYAITPLNGYLQKNIKLNNS